MTFFVFHSFSLLAPQKRKLWWSIGDKPCQVLYLHFICVKLEYFLTTASDLITCPRHESTPTHRHRQRPPRPHRHCAHGGNSRRRSPHNPSASQSRHFSGNARPAYGLSLRRSLLHERHHRRRREEENH